MEFLLSVCGEMFRFSASNESDKKEIFQKNQFSSSLKRCALEMWCLFIFYSADYSQEANGSSLDRHLYRNTLRRKKSWSKTTKTNDDNDNNEMKEKDFILLCSFKISSIYARLNGWLMLCVSKSYLTNTRQLA